MRSTDAAPSEADLSTRARIREAAIECFAHEGFEVSVRTIAERAGVSAGLVIHHYGSKAVLREVCDDQVAHLIAELETEGLAEGGSQTFLHHLASVEQYATLTGYVIRSLQAGGPLAAALYERMVEDTERYFAEGEAIGLIRPSRDPAGRARWAVASAIGSLLLLVALRHPGAGVDHARVLRDWTEEYMLPTLELYTEGIFTDRAVFDAYLAHLADPSSDPS